MNLRKIVSKIKRKLGLYDLRSEGEKWVKKNLGEEYVPEFLDKYDRLSSGVPIGGIYETLVFIEMIETIREQMNDHE